ncbi:putative pectinesterase [Helianthus anomalus]
MQTLRIIILTVSVVLLLAVIIGAVSRTLIHNRNSNDDSIVGSNISAQSLKAVCSQTLYPESCYNSISEINKSNSTDPEELLKLSLQVVLKSLSDVATLPDKLGSKTTNETVKKALDVCGTVLNDAVECL